MHAALITLFRASQPVKSLTLAVLASLLLLTQAAQAQVGPFNPADIPKPPKKASPSVDKIKDTFNKWFGTAEEGTPTETENVVKVRKGAGTPGQFDMITRHRKAQPTKGESEQLANTSSTSAGNSTPAAKGQRLVPSRQASVKTHKRPPLLSQAPLVNPQIDEPTVSEENPPMTMLTLENDENPYGITHAQNRLNNTAQLINNQQIEQARSELIPLKEWLIEATEAHIGLYKALNKIPSARVQAELEKQVALEFAQMRDTAMYQMARILLSEERPDEAIDLLVEVVKSQPGSTIGLKSYEALQTIGFTQKLQLVEK